MKQEQYSATLGLERKEGLINGLKQEIIDRIKNDD